ncbi:MAG: UbiD family decarboxylase [Desulfovibrio sp.]|nr:UbiD family decarboxylase [Desulfovibrio sp.]
MSYRSLAHCVKDLEAIGQVRRIDVPIDPNLEMAALQRRVFAAKGPVLLFTNVLGTPFPMVCNLFGTMERLEYIFRQELPVLESLFHEARSFANIVQHPFRNLLRLGSLLSSALRTGVRTISPESAPVLSNTCSLDALPRLVSWPEDGGPFITLPLVYSEDPIAPGTASSNLGMYRIQMGGNAYEPNEVGLHYQIHRGLGVHHAHALQKGQALPVNIFVGGPPELTLAAVMPMPEGMSELRFAGLLGGSVTMAHPKDGQLPVMADCDFCIQGHIAPKTKPEGSFGDHMGYYSLQHPFPVLTVEKVSHRNNALWPFTTVGRPPMEDTVFGTFIHRLTAPLVGKVFPGIHSVHAVDACGVHPLLLALGHERYTPYAIQTKPQELLREAFHLLGTSQTALAKYLLIASKDDAPALTVNDVGHFLSHVLERTDFARDLHFLSHVPCDTLDYSGSTLNHGSKLIWAVAGERRRVLGTEIPAFPELPEGFRNVVLIAPGILAFEGPKHQVRRGEQDPVLFALAQAFDDWPFGEHFPLLVLVDDAAFVARHFANFLWVTFTRTDPATDSYGAKEGFVGKQWVCQAPLILDARSKHFHPKVLEEDPATIQRIESLAQAGGPLAGLW